MGDDVTLFFCSTGRREHRHVVEVDVGMSLKWLGQTSVLWVGLKEESSVLTGGVEKSPPMKGHVVVADGTQACR